MNRFSNIYGDKKDVSSNAYKHFKQIKKTEKKQRNEKVNVRQSDRKYS